MLEGSKFKISIPPYSTTKITIEIFIQTQQIMIVIKLINFKSNGNMNKSNVDPNPTLLMALKDNVKSNHQNGRILNGISNHLLLVEEEMV